MNKVKLGAAVPPMSLPVCLLGSNVNDKPTFCPIAWSTIIDDEPPRIGLVTAKKRYTKDGIVQTETFSVNIPDIKIAEPTDYCGIVSGYDTDKSKVFETFSGETGAPMISDCPVTAECRLEKIIEFEGTDLIVGRIVNVYADDEILEQGKADALKMNPLMYFTCGSIYYSLGEKVGKAFKIGKEFPSHE